MSTITVDELRRQLQTVEDETADAFKQAAAIGALRRKVERLRHESVHGATDEACETAARDLVRASEDLRVAEIVEPRKLAARDAAQAKRIAAAVSVISAAASHFEKLRLESYDLGTEILDGLISAGAKAIRSDQDQMGRVRDQALGQFNGFIAYDAWMIAEECRSMKSAGAAAITYANDLLGSFDANTVRIQADIDKLRKVLAAVDSSAAEAASTGGDQDSSPGATVTPEKPAKANKPTAHAEPAAA